MELNNLYPLRAKGYHVCLKERISYDEDVPIGGPHRPVWVTYGEYYYMVRRLDRGSRAARTVFDADSFEIASATVDPRDGAW